MKDVWSKFYLNVIIERFKAFSDATKPLFALFNIFTYWWIESSKKAVVKKCAYI